MATKSIWNTPIKDSKGYLKAILSIHKVGDIIADAHFRKDVKEVFQNHPYKIAEEPFKVIVTEDQRFKSKCFGILNSDNEIIRFSVGNVAKGAFNLTTALSEIFREAVWRDVQDKKASLIEQHGLRCMKSGSSCSRSDLTLNHDHPFEFNKIVETFLRSQNIKVDKKLFEISDHQKLVLRDRKLEVDFRKYHKTFLDDGYVSLMSRKHNVSLGTSYKFKSKLEEEVDFKSAHQWQKTQPSLFDGAADGV